MSVSFLSANKINRRTIQVVLGILWFIDGLLQLQHQMFTPSLGNQVIQPVTVGQPGVVSVPINFAIRILVMHPALYNTFFALIQISLGVFILWKLTAKQALIASVFWALIVWYFGEGMGGIFGGQTILLMGAPGAALIYAILALATLPPKESGKDDLKKQRPAYWLVLVWAVLWIGGAIYQLLPGQNSSQALGSMISGSASGGAPGWLAAADIHVAHSIDSRGLWFIFLLAAVQALIGIAVLLPGLVRRVAVFSGIVLALCFWVFGQSLGSYYSGLATDPNSGPLFVLLGVAILGSGQFSFSKLGQDLSRFSKHLENALT